MKTFVEPIPKEFPVKRLKLDPNNPRLRLYPGGNKEKEIIERMCRVPSQSPSQVVKHILTDRGFLHNEIPVVFIESGSKDLIVIDGNRRTAALKMILDPSLIPSTRHGLKADCEKLNGLVPDKIRCWITRSRSDAKRIVYRAHNEGSREWETLSKYATHFDYHKSNAGIGEICEMTGQDPATILRQINTWILVESMIEYIPNFQIESAGITSFERAATSYSEFPKLLGIALNNEGAYQAINKEQATLIHQIYVNSALKSGFSRDVPNNDASKAAFLRKIVPEGFANSLNESVILEVSLKPAESPTDQPHSVTTGTPPPATGIPSPATGIPSPATGTPPPATASHLSNAGQLAAQNVQGKSHHTIEALPSIRQILLVKRNVGPKAYAIFKEFSDLSQANSDFPIASAALTRAMIETTLKFHAKRLKCYSESPELQKKHWSDLMDSMVSKLKQAILSKNLTYSSELVSSITNCCKSLTELNDVMHKDGSFAARPAVSSALSSLAHAVQNLVKIPT